MNADFLVQSIFKRIREGVAAKDTNRFLERTFIPEPPVSNPPNLDATTEAALALVREQPLCIYIDHKSLHTLGGHTRFAARAPEFPFVQISGAGYLGLADFSDFPFDVIPVGVCCLFLTSPLQVFAFDTKDKHLSEFRLNNLRLTLESRIIATVTKSTGGVIAYGSEKVTSSEPK